MVPTIFPRPIITSQVERTQAFIEPEINGPSHDNLGRLWVSHVDHYVAIRNLITKNRRRDLYAHRRLGGEPRVSNRAAPQRASGPIERRAFPRDGDDETRRDVDLKRDIPLSDRPRMGDDFQRCEGHGFGKIHRPKSRRIPPSAVPKCSFTAHRRGGETGVGDPPEFHMCTYLFNVLLIPL